jgi:hypothetical protein
LTIDVAGQPFQFSQPFVLAFMETEQAPAQYDVTVPISGSALVWDGTVPFDTFDFLALQSDSDLTITFEVDIGASTFELGLRGGGFPLTLPVGTNITQIDAANAGTTAAATLTVFIAQEAQ